METRHVRLNYKNALDAKKQVLSLEINFLHMLRMLKSYETLRKKEFSEKNKLKINLTSLKAKTKLIKLTFPEQESKIKKQTKTISIKKQNRKNLQKEVEEIKEKLKRLSK